VATRLSFRISGVIVVFFTSCTIEYPFLPIFTGFPEAGKRISIYIHFDPFINQINQKEALLLPLFSY
jgi:hypothetical protein